MNDSNNFPSGKSNFYFFPTLMKKKVFFFGSNVVIITILCACKVERVEEFLEWILLIAKKKLSISLMKRKFERGGFPAFTHQHRHRRYSICSVVAKWQVATLVLFFQYSASAYRQEIVGWLWLRSWWKCYYCQYQTKMNKKKNEQSFSEHGEYICYFPLPKK